MNTVVTPPTPVGRRPTRRGRHHLGIVAAGAALLGTAPIAVLYESWTWLAQGAVAVAVVALAAAAARSLRAPVPLQVLAMLAALTIAVTWQFRSGGELFLLPTAETVSHFQQLLADVPAVVAAEVIPVPDHDGLLLLTMAGVGVVAIVVDVLVVSLRRPALTGLPLLAIYAIPVAVSPDRISPIPFAIAGAGFLWLIATERLERIRRFGRRFTAEGRDVPTWEPSPLAAAGRRLAVAGIVLAVLVPLAVPGMTSGLADRWGGGSGEGDGEGNGSPTSVNLFAHLDGLLNQDQTVQLVRFTTDDPNPFYLRVGTADQVSARGFHHRAPQGALVSDRIRPATTDRPGVTRHEHRAEIEILEWSMNRLPIFAELTGVSGVGGDWRHDPDQQVVFAGNEQPNGLTYKIEYARRTFDPDALRRARPLASTHPMTRFTDVLPEPEVSELVAELTADTDNVYDEVLAILDHFSRENGFRYSLHTGPDTTGSAIVDFLFENRVGYCVQYAAAMTWLVREAGHPARVAIGFTRGGQRDGDTYTLTNRNLHAWTEVYFDGFGWVPFDPTPSASVTGTTSPAWAPNPDAPEDPGASDQDPSGEGVPERNPDGLDTGPNELAPEPGGGTLGALPGEESPTWPWWTAGVIAAMLLILMLPALSRQRLRRRRLNRTRTTTDARARAHAAWDELVDLLTDHQVALRTSESPRAAAARLTQQLQLDQLDGGGAASGRRSEQVNAGDAAGKASVAAGEASAAAGKISAGDALQLLSRAEERARYAPTPPADMDLARAIRVVRQAVAARSGRLGRWRAVALPPSVLVRWQARLNDVGTRLAAVTGRVGEAMARMSPRRLLRH